MSPISLVNKYLGKYRIVESLGRGGMGYVYKAYHPSLDRFVAVKVLRPDLTDEKDLFSRFQQEARAIAGLRHPNIVQVYDFDEHNGIYFMVMELLEGNTLKQYLNFYRGQSSKIPLRNTTRIILDILAGLSFAHSQSVIHRDIKPANVLLAKSGQAVITDFGIAQILGGAQNTKTGALLGTLNYMAPEQGRDGKCDIRSDIYSLGVIFYEMLVGDVPFDADTPLALLMKHINEPLPTPRSLDPTVPEALENIVLRILAKNPDERYQSASEVSNDIVNASNKFDFLNGDTITHPNTVPPSEIQVVSGIDKFNIGDNAMEDYDTDVISKTTNKHHTKNNHNPSGVLLWIPAISLGNMLILWASGLYSWDILLHLWPMELVFSGSLFFILILENHYHWLTIPGCILVGNGLFLSYFTLSGRWEDWAIFWPAEPLLLAFAILAPFWLSNKNPHNEVFLRWLAISAIVFAGLAFIASFAAAIIQTF